MKTNDISLFDFEKRVIDEALDFIESGSNSPERIKKKFRSLLDRYVKLYKQCKRLIRFSDRMQNEMNRLNQQLLRSENKYRNIFENASEGIFRARPDGTLIEVNPAFARIIANRTRSPVSVTQPDCLRNLCSHLTEQGGYQDFLKHLKKAEKIQNYETRFLRINGEQIWVAISGVLAHEENGKGDHIEGIISDITERRRLHRKLEKMAHTDELTGIYNRRFFYETLKLEICNARCSSRPLSLLMIDADHFKKINDNYGHLTGDRLLQLLVRTCRAVLREKDILGRLGGEEFAVILPGVDLFRGRQVAERLRRCIEKTSLDDDGRPVSITVSMGLSQLTRTVTTTEDLVKKADEALYRAKEKGRNLVCIHRDGETDDRICETRKNLKKVAFPT